MAVAVHATAADLAAVTDVLVDAFAADPVQQWLFAECDRSGLLAHLESSNVANLAFYERHGFEATASYRCGGHGPQMTSMSRPSR
jgi:ribosomal protein S18 acetylase RimI-like enzyme